MAQEVLAGEQLLHPPKRLEIINYLVSAINSHNRRVGVVTNFQIDLVSKDGSAPKRYLMNSVLKQVDGRLKWQGTLMAYGSWPEKG
jgi:hypothetical protein